MKRTIAERLGIRGKRRETGKGEWMKEPYAEGLANHSGRKLCADVREDIGEALAAVHTGWVLSLENLSKRSADAVAYDGRQHKMHRNSEMYRDFAWSKTPNMYGTPLHGNRDIPESTMLDRNMVRIENPKGESR